ncbi:MAG: hypothetical protein IJZ80_03370 [Clostridia bacterium]|nr:hypothetical protein [Clostridia bacterium]
MKQYVSPCVLTVELSAEDILTASDLSLDLSRIYQLEGDVIDIVNWNRSND